MTQPPYQPYQQPGEQPGQPVDPWGSPPSPASAPSPYGAPAPYGYPNPVAYGYEQPKDDSLGIIALVLGILGLVMLGPLTSIPAIFVGIAGRRRADQGRATNKGMATAGMWLGIVVTVLTVLAIIAFIAFIVFAASQGTDGMSSALTR